MTTPSRRLSGADFSHTGPSRSIVQKLLDEIDGVDKSPKPEKRASTPGLRSQKGSNNTLFSAKSARRSSSAWVGGSTIALEARDKLRAADEARQRRLWKDLFEPEPAAPLRRRSTQSSINSDLIGISIWKAPGPLLSLGDVHHSNDPPPTQTHTVSQSPRAHSISRETSCWKLSNIGLISSQLATKRLHSPPHSPGSSSKRRRHNTQRSADECSECLAPSCAVQDAKPNVVQQSPVSSAPPRPPKRPISPGEVPPTPAWMKPLQLMADDEKAILFNVHGDD
ncbi:hypothetical protein EJ04DRAFT_563030 [Polyplosphaeria fusca]|uniref:Uncharacterized protein n=1 Tax=Polyplosphaeria fusca TaxID=682080 RepID=A0A9P4R396_9PLEO|nr:hypothetical protein EJ04DRAFT_563030 [Polyplosphaeria fusca]